MAELQAWRCKTCGRRVRVPASTWPGPVQDRQTGHVCCFVRSFPGRPRKDPVDEPAEASDRVDVDELEELDQQFGDPVGAWFDRARRGRKR